MVVENYKVSEPEVQKMELFKLADFVLREQNAPQVASINFVCQNDIQKLNKEYRGIDKPTDVLSFETDIEEDMGDIFICVDVARENAKKFNTSLEDELRLLVTHGMLHLCGYDHIDEKEAEVMEAEEDRCLKAAL